LRLGEYVAALWLGGAALLFLRTGRWQALLLVGGTPYSPFVHVLLVTISVSLLRLVLLSSHKLRLAPAVLRGTASAGELQETMAFADELRLLKGMLGFLRDCFPLYCILLLYPTSDFLIDSLQGSRLVDPALIKVDEALFAGHASVWLQRFVSPQLTDVMSLCYFLHLIVSPLVVLVAALRAPRGLFVEVTEGFVLMSVIGVTLYVLFPAIGPLHTLSHLYTRDLAGGLITDANRVLIDATRVPRDCFPSLHVAISALLLVYAWRVSRSFALLVAPFVVGNWVSTLYLRYHYLIDVVAGFALVPIVYAAVRAWTRRFPVPDASAEPSVAADQGPPPRSAEAT
jgi:membrane-associated phospholipid phosphatase